MIRRNSIDEFASKLVTFCAGLLTGLILSYALMRVM